MTKLLWTSYEKSQETTSCKKQHTTGTSDAPGFWNGPDTSTKITHPTANAQTLKTDSQEFARVIQKCIQLFVNIIATMATQVKIIH